METTKNLDCVFFNSLVCSDLFVGTTYPILLILVPLFLLIIGGYWQHKRGIAQAAKRQDQAEAARLLKLMHMVKDYSFRRTPIVCSTKDEKLYYEKVLREYNNVGRKVEYIERKKEQSSHQYQAVKAQFTRYYCAAHRDVIRMGEENAGLYWDGLIKKGLLDYLSTPKGPNWEASQKYILEVTKYLVKNDKPRPSDQAKQKLALDIMPSDRIG